jgi:hypothetical protein
MTDFNVGDRIRVVAEDYDGVESGTLATVDSVSEQFVIAVVDGYQHDELDAFMASLVGAPDGSLPFRHEQVELVHV